jgi:hypothetical protein
MTAQRLITSPITSPKRAKEMAEGVLAQLEEVAAHGLDKVYKSHFDFACDLCADLPWDEGNMVSFAWLVNQPRLKAASDTILARGGPDYFTMFQDGLTPDLTGTRTKNDKDSRWRNRK